MLTWVEINRKAIRHNIREFRRLVGGGIQLMPVIKSNAYGHGFLEVARICEKEPAVDRVCVASLTEALNLRTASFKKPIIVLSFYELEPKYVELAIRKKIALPVYTVEQLKMLDAAAQKIGERAAVHLKIDTGTTRVGILPAEIPLFAKKLHATPHVYLEGIWSHFASSEEDAVRTADQLAAFTAALAALRKENIKADIAHIACSASTVLHAKSHCNAVRFGISLYGLHPAQSTYKKINLRPALAWYTKIIQLKKIPAGTKISYGGTYKTKKETTLAILPVGYWDGYDRHLSNQGEVLVRGHRCPIRGRICMNLTMVDVTAVKEAKAGDTVTLIGRDQDTEVSADELAARVKTINYEIVTRINPLIPRLYI